MALAPNTGYGLLNPGTTTPPSLPPNSGYGALNPGTTTPKPTFGDPQRPQTGTILQGNDPTNLANDWYKAYFGNYNLPPDVQQNLINILQKYASDPATAQALATQYLRGTDWYQTQFPGFNAGVQNGLFGDEQGYLSYLNSVNNIYNQYLGRHVSGDEISALLAEGVSPDIIARRFMGQAYIQANQPDIQYLAGAFGNGQLTKDQLTALGNEQAGIDTAQGQIQQKIQQKAQQIYSRIFQGSLATPSLSLGANGLQAPGLSGTTNRQQPDVAA